MTKAYRICPQATTRDGVVEDPLTAVEEFNEEQQQPPIEEGITDVKGFPSEPHDTSVLRDFENHIALRVWNGEVCKS